MVSGAWLGGQRAVLLMQSSGVGNCVNITVLRADAPEDVEETVEGW